MERSELESTEILKKFAAVLTEYQNSVIRNYDIQDPFQFVQEYRSIAGEAALNYVKSSSSEQNYNEVGNYELEAKLWYLVDLLFSFRTSEDTGVKVSTHDYNSDAAFKKELLQRDRSLYEIWLIIAWIQDNLALPSRPESLPTTKWSHSMISGSLKSSDSDYPLREGREKIDVRDLEEDHTFFKYIYELILAGKYNEVRQECEYCDNLTLSMIMCGLEDYVDPKKDLELAEDYDSQQGIQKHALWRRAVYALSQNPAIDKYEAAIYKFLAGDIPQLEAEEFNWDKEFLVYLNQLWNVTIENYLLGKGRINSEELIIAMPSQPLTLPNILNIVASKHMEESKHPIRVLIGSVILNTIPSVIKSFDDILLDIVKGVESEQSLMLEPYLLRILTHLVIFMDKVCPNMIAEDDKSNLITKYISLLTFYEQYELVPVYISFLGEEDAMEAYSYFLSNLKQPEVRQRQLELSHYLQLPTANILRRTAQRTFNDTESHYVPKNVIEVTSEVTSTDEHLISAVDWLLEGRLYTDAVESIVALSRRFLLNGKVSSLETFFSKHSFDEIVKSYELDQLAAKDDNAEDKLIKELNEYCSLIATFKKYKEWETAQSNHVPDSNITALLRQFQDLSTSLRNLASTFLVDLAEDADIDQEDKTILHSIRSLYTPYLIIVLHACYVKAADTLKIKSFLQEAVNLSVLVANETDKIYLLFQANGNLNEYLQLVAKAVALLGQ
ncbi:HCL090Wp [Eremothecium sinecaudum]|uniref:Nuclear pore complex protein n=1 Tax=Eremothecium sinecaudum TaxID=45286 RepID=A0A0X8HRE0_9SACH|nr:HCL090Wp [Eremothecium sinecaudum]AMD20061.1 HCL090Wp [Eremothecium sinecaudum]